MISGWRIITYLPKLSRGVVIFDRGNPPRFIAGLTLQLLCQPYWFALATLDVGESTWFTLRGRLLQLVDVSWQSHAEFSGDALCRRGSPGSYSATRSRNFELIQ